MYKQRVLLWTAGLILLLFLSVIMSLMIGSVHLPVDTTLSILINHLPFVEMEPYWSVGQETIIWDLRLPRIILSIIVGAMLSVSGVAFQGVLRNPLADPYILGVSSGAALGAAATILFLQQTLWASHFTIPLIAFIGAVLSLGFVMLLSNVKNQRGNETIILAGVITQAFSGAMLTFLIAISGEQMHQIIFWMMGSLANKDWIDILILIPYYLIGTIYLYIHYQELNLLALGERSAIHLGMNVERKKIFILMVGTILAASAVSIVGIIGFVGLIIPHMIRLITGPDHRKLLLISTLVGSIFLLWTDTLARTIVPSQELPIGVITAFIGAPFFAYLLRKGLRRGIG